MFLYSYVDIFLTFFQETTCSYILDYLFPPHIVNLESGQIRIVISRERGAHVVKNPYASQY